MSSHRGWRRFAGQTTARVLVLSGVLVVTAGASASSISPRLLAGRVYGGLTATRVHGGYVALRTASATVIAASPANTAPELLHSNINLGCSNGAQLNTGMVKITLKRSRGRYRFSTHFVRQRVAETPPGSGTVTLDVTISGTVASSTKITGNVKVIGPNGCEVAKQKYTAPLLSKR